VRTLVDRRCSKDIGPGRPKLFVLDDCSLTLKRGPSSRQVVSVQVSVLLDTGTDVTIVRPEKITELERSSGPLDFELCRYGSPMRHEPLYFDIGIAFPGARKSSSFKYGIVAPRSWKFDVADLWLGQDILSRFVTTFDGPKGRIKIVDPSIVGRRRRR